MNALVKSIAKGDLFQIKACLEQGHVLTRKQLNTAFITSNPEREATNNGDIIDMLVQFNALPQGISVPLLKTVLDLS